MEEEFQSHTLQRYLKNFIANSVYKHQLPNLFRCGSMVDMNHGISVLSNGTSTRILGVKLCNNSWGCPACTARQMAKYSKRVAAAIDALAKENLIPIMITFTIFHTIKETCQLTFDLLRKTWTDFSKNAKWSRKRKTPIIKKQKNNIADGETYQSGGVWNQFITHFEINHFVKATEVTYGKHGWHPHLHILYFIPKDKLNEVMEWQEPLCEAWLKFEDRTAKKLMSPSTYEIRKFLASKQTRPDAEHKGLYISQNEDGTIKEFHSADYVCGWGANNELTNQRQLKKGRQGNLTPLQLLEKSYNLQYDNPKESRKLMRKYLAFMLTQHRNRIHRIDFSRTGLKKIIDKWLTSNEYKEQFKKKCQALKVAPYKTVCWIPGITWKKISYLNDYRNAPIIPLIIRFATYENGYQLITELFMIYNLPPPLQKHPSTTHDWEKYLNDKIAGIAA